MGNGPHVSHFRFVLSQQTRKSSAYLPHCAARGAGVARNSSGGGAHGELANSAVHARKAACFGDRQNLSSVSATNDHLGIKLLAVHRDLVLEYRELFEVFRAL